MDEIRKNVAANLAANRKRLNMTQLQLAALLNYSDKAVSKWERGDAVPDVFVLKKAADIFGITVDELIGPPAEAPEEPKEEKRLTHGSKALIAVISAGLVWLVATVVFAVLRWVDVKKAWLSF
ncbi:MAG: helix-turn-helix transcriptional regulator, partial [Clostridia bacterium]|nr:helix-turn-helix transcriptional regulator [Clostridia bacterium]